MAVTPQNQPYQSPTPGKITLMAFAPNNGNAAMSEALCQELKDCGFNSAAVETTAVNALPTLNNCTKHGIKPFLHVAKMEDSVAICDPFVQLCKKAQGLGGWLLKSGVTQTQTADGSNLSRSADFIRKNDQYVVIDTYKYVMEGNKPVKEDVRITYPHPIFMSALYHSELTASTTPRTYKAYIETFQDNLQPSMWPFFTFPGSGDISTFPTGDFYKELESFALMARYTGAPIWPYMLCRMESGLGNNLSAGAESRIRSASFSAMAYGAQGLVWWTYRPTTSANKTFNGLIDSSGNRTPLWSVVQRINNRISVLNSVFAGCRPVEYRHTGTTYYDGTCLLKGAIGPVISLLTGSAGVLVSHLSNGGDDYLVIVNHPGAPLQKLTLGFSSLYKIERIDVSTTGTITRSLLSSYNLDLNLAAGEMEVFRWWGN